MIALRSVALVESPTQLLNVLEWAHRPSACPTIKVVVLAPSDELSVRQLDEVAGMGRGSGVDVEILHPRRRSPSGVRAMARVTQLVARAEQLVIGDPFSGMIQALLPLTRAVAITVVDDGTATWEFSDCITEHRPMQRWRMAEADATRALRTTERLTPGKRELTVFTCLTGAAPRGAEVAVNSYAWTRSMAPAQVSSGTDVVGASLVDTGVVRREAYLDAVADLAGRFGPIRYFAHRRESADLVVAIRAIPGVEVHRAERPIELELRLGVVGSHVITFPSTAAYTLPIVLSDTGVRIEVRSVRESWFTSTTTEHARQFVRRIGTDANLPQALESA